MTKSVAIKSRARVVATRLQLSPKYVPLLHVTFLFEANRFHPTRFNFTEAYTKSARSHAPLHQKNRGARKGDEEMQKRSANVSPNGSLSRRRVQ